MSLKWHNNRIKLLWVSKNDHPADHESSCTAWFIMMLSLSTAWVWAGKTSRIRRKADCYCVVQQGRMTVTYFPTNKIPVSLLLPSIHTLGSVYSSASSEILRDCDHGLKTNAVIKTETSTKNKQTNKQTKSTWCFCSWKVKWNLRVA